MRKPEKPNTLQFHLECILRIYRDCAALCSLSPSSQLKDIETLKKRTQHEGMVFLTRGLPSLGKALDKSLSSDSTFESPPSFAVSAKTGRPKFLAGFWDLIYAVDDQWDGIDAKQLSFDSWWALIKASIRMEEDRILAVRAVRQICYLLYKLEGAHTPESEVECLQNFVHTDTLLPDPDAEVHLSRESLRALDNARAILGYVLKDLSLTDIRPKHGPGAVATGEKLRGKWSFSRYYAKLDELYPYSDYFFYNYTHLADSLEDLEALVELPAATAKVVLVPKDSRGPRIISMEPLELQWIQQGQMRALVNHLEHHPVTAGYVNFTSQEINRDLALLNSCPNGELVTMDMKDASDRVSIWLLKKLLSQHHLQYLMASRSDQTMLPDGHVICLKKFAPMGSAVCFPVEALVFWALAVGTIQDIRCARDFHKLPSVYVFGDDIILPKGNYEAVCSVLEELYLKVNKDKCCVGRFFRESCGMDAYNQVCVTPVRHHKHFTVSSPPALLAYVAYVNAHSKLGHKSTASYIKGRLISEFGQIPVTNVEGSHPLAIVDDTLSNEDVVRRNSSHFKRRYNKRLQRWEFRVLTPSCPAVMLGEPDWLELHRRSSMGFLHDPFGFSGAVFEPCRYQLPQRTTLRWAWVDESQLAGL